MGSPNLKRVSFENLAGGWSWRSFGAALVVFLCWLLAEAIPQWITGQP